jgi:hypothetical protein
VVRRHAIGPRNAPARGTKALVVRYLSSRSDESPDWVGPAGLLHETSGLQVALAELDGVYAVLYSDQAARFTPSVGGGSVRDAKPGCPRAPL